MFSGRTLTNDDKIYEAYIAFKKAYDIKRDEKLGRKLERMKVLLLLLYFLILYAKLFTEISFCFAEFSVQFRVTCLKITKAQKA